jgi:serine/threonine protein kinase
MRQFRLGVTKPTKPAPRHSRHVAQLGTLPPDVLNQLDRVIQRAMAIKPKDRYQYVADFANDLKQIMRAFPPPTPPAPGPSRPVDPNSTQPDLPMLYETLQAAKDKANQGGQETRDASPPSRSSSPIPTSTPPTSTTSNCPRCNEPISPRSVFCPRCGRPLGGSSAQNNIPNPASNAGIYSADQTVVVTPPTRSAQTATKGKNTTPYGPDPSTSPGQVSYPAAYSQQRNVPATAQAPATPSLSRQNDTFNERIPQRASMNRRSTTPSQLNLDPRILISLAVVLVILLVLIALLVSRL